MSKRVEKERKKEYRRVEKGEIERERERERESVCLCL